MTLRKKSHGLMNMNEVWAIRSSYLFRRAFVQVGLGSHLDVLLNKILADHWTL